jgi:histidine triad (HIT) family protein
MSECIVCRIGAHDVDAVILYEDDDIMAFLDRAPIRPVHTQIITKIHVATFEELPEDFAARALTLGQALARRMKTAYAVDRVAFLFTGGDVPHVHAHVVPMHQTTDITSAQYLIGPTTPDWGSNHLIVDRLAPEAVLQDMDVTVSLGV